jgi:hypothetical protein
MGYPDNYKLVVSDTQAYRQFGNSVVVPVVERIAEAVMASLNTPLGKKRDLVLRSKKTENVESLFPKHQNPDTTYPAKKKTKKKNDSR